MRTLPTFRSDEEIEVIVRGNFLYNTGGLRVTLPKRNKKVLGVNLTLSLNG